MKYESETIYTDTCFSDAYTVRYTLRIQLANPRKERIVLGSVLWEELSNTKP